MSAIRQVPRLAALAMLLTACGRLPTTPNEAADERPALGIATTGEEYHVLERDHLVGNQLMAGDVGSYRQSFGLVAKQGGHRSWCR